MIKINESSNKTIVDRSNSDYPLYKYDFSNNVYCDSDRETYYYTKKNGRFELYRSTVQKDYYKGAASSESDAKRKLIDLAKSDDWYNS